MRLGTGLLSLSRRAAPLAAAACLVSVLCAFAHTVHSPGAPRHVIVDTDMGLDDVRAVFALLADSTTAVDAFVTVEGSTSLGRGTDILVGLLEAGRSGSIPVVRGLERPGLGEPPWRRTANSLAGATFPPPRNTTVADFSPAVMAGVMDRSTDVDYLALGPLGNLMALRSADPQGFRRIGAIWIPAVLEGRSMSGWNLTYDSEASAAVFGSGARIFVIDVSGAEEVDGVGFLSSLEGPSPPVLWVKRMLDGLGPGTGHVTLFDDLAAAAFLREDLVEFDEQAFTAMQTDGGFDLIPSPDGNVRIARLTDLDGALAALRNLYARGPLDRGSHSHDRKEEVPVETLLRAFHGHLGPYVVIGYRMGKLALARLDSKGHFGISAEVHSPRVTPSSCLIDGVQIGSGCTLGKGNILVEEAPAPAWAVFKTEAGRQVTIRLRPGIPGLVRDLVEAKGVEAAGRAFLAVDVDSLFTVEHAPR